MSANAIMSVVPQGDDLVCILDNGQKFVVDWRQAWTYRRAEDGDDALAIARRAYEQAPDLFSPAGFSAPADVRTRSRSARASGGFVSRMRKAGALILASIGGGARGADEKE
ncbi:hypothetical protein [Sphingobium mellinum]|uniref:hypothetical protein n=1 Tax=Sphingobium mellinum TaxID=1387166 RepID=UPI0030EC2971